MRIALGFDSHKLIKNNDKKLVIGGVKINCEFSPIAHSDGDALCHALIDCISTHFLNKSIGEIYSDKDNKNLNGNSLLNLKDIYFSLNSPSINNIDIVIQTDAFLIKDYKDEITSSLANTLNINRELITLKGKTTEGIFNSDIINVWCVVLFK